MSEPLIMPVKPGALSPLDVARLGEIGVVVIETENPNDIFLIRPDAKISSTGMLMAAVKTIQASSYTETYQNFGKQVARVLMSAMEQQSEKAP
jgi:hypothetical protein